MLKDSFYSVSHFQATEKTVHATLKLNPEHPILKGHFPGLPIVPGVCMLQMLKECLEETQHRKLILKEAKNCKFLTLLDPLKYDFVEVFINFESSTDGILVSDGNISNSGTSFLKVQKVKYQ